MAVVRGAASQVKIVYHGLTAKVTARLGALSECRVAAARGVALDSLQPYHRGLYMHVKVFGYYLEGSGESVGTLRQKMPSLDLESRLGSNGPSVEFIELLQSSSIDVLLTQVLLEDIQKGRLKNY